MPLIAEDAAQHGFAFRFGWGAEGLAALAPDCDVIVIVDVLRFTSAVSVAVAGGSIVFPYRWSDDSAAESIGGDLWQELFAAVVANRYAVYGP